MKKPGQVSVEVPEDDSPPWGKVGIIAVIGFVVGVAWPKLTGVKLGPNAPGESTTAPASSGQRAPEAPHEVALSAATVQGKPAASQAGPAAAVPPKPAGVTVTVGHGAVISCKTADGDKKSGGKECGISGFDGVAMPRLQNLAQCSAAASAQGKLSAVFTLDYAGGRMDMSVGKSSTVKDPDAFLTCMRTELNGVVLKGIPHEHPRYLVAYSVSFEPKDAGKPESPPAANAAPAKDDPKGDHGAGSAQVTWETALVRDQPKTGTVVARLPRGTKVTTTSSRDGWYKVSCPDGEGWVYRGAIGR